MRKTNKTTTIDTATFEQQITDVLTQFEKAIVSLQTKVEMATQMALTAMGHVEDLTLRIETFENGTITRVNDTPVRLLNYRPSFVSDDPDADPSFDTRPSIRTAPKQTSPKQGLRKPKITRAMPNDPAEQFDAMVVECVGLVKQGQRSKYFNSNIIPQFDNDPRVYLTRVPHRAFKLAAKAAGYTTKEAAQILADAM